MYNTYVRYNYFPLAFLCPGLVFIIYSSGKHITLKSSKNREVTQATTESLYSKC